MEVEIEGITTKHSLTTGYSDEEISETIGLLRGRIDEHNDSRIQVQEELDGICSKLRDQLDQMEVRVNENLKNLFEKEDTTIQETMTELLILSGVEKKDDEQRRRVAELMTKAKAILLVKQSYGLKKPKNTGKAETAFDNAAANFRDIHIMNYGMIRRRNIIIDDFMDVEDDNYNDENNGDDKNEDEEEKDPELSNLYELDVRNGVVAENLHLRRPEEVKIARARAGYIYLNFVGSFNAEEEKIISEHGLTESIVCKAAVRTDDAEEWVEYNMVPNGDGEWSFLPQLFADVITFVRVRTEFNGATSEWSECVEFTPSFSEFCGWKVRTKKSGIGKNICSVSEENPMVVTYGAHYEKNHLAMASVILPPNKVSSWSFKILKKERNYSPIFFVGVTSLNENGAVRVNPDNPEIVPGWYLDCFCSMRVDTQKRFIGRMSRQKSQWVNRELHVGDSVGVITDAIRGEISFLVNGVNLGVAYKGVPLDKPLVPCVIFARKGDSVELDTSEVKENEVDKSVPVPSNVTVSSITWDSITLTWDNVEDASFYQIETSKGRTWCSTAENSFTFGMLAPNAEYSFRVRTVIEDSVSAWSDVVSEKTASPPDFSECVWKEYPSDLYRDYRMSQYSVDKNDPRVVSCISNTNRYGMTGNIMLQPNKVTSWKVKLLDFKNGIREQVLVGVAPFYSEEKNREDIILDHFDSRKEWYLDCISLKLFSGPPHMASGKAYGPRKRDGEYVHVGDTVGVIMDTTKGELSFVINGVNLGVAYEGIPLDKPLAPSVRLTSPGSTVMLDPTGVELNVVNSSILPPGDVSVRDCAWNSITLGWSAVEGATSYQVEVDGTGQMLDSTTTCSYSRDELLPGTEHNFRVRSACGNAVSEWSDVVAARTGEEYPDFSECTWKEAGENGYYELDRATKRIATKKTLLSTLGSYFCKVLGTIPLPVGTVVSWSVKILNANSEEPNLGIFVGIAPYDISTLSDSHRLDDREEYYRCQHPGTEIEGNRPSYAMTRPRKKQRKSIGKGSTIGVVMDTVNGEISFFVNGVNYGVMRRGIPLDKPLVPCVILSGQSDSVELDTSEVKENVDSSIPVPSNITSKSATWNSVTLTWDKVEGASFYQIEVDGSKSWDVSTTNTFIKRGFLAETEHSFRVRAVRGSSVSEWSDVLKGRTPKAPEFSECVWEEHSGDVDEERKSSVDKENSRITTKISGSDGFCTVIGNTHIPPNKVTSWSVKILKSMLIDRLSICIGVVPNGISQRTREHSGRLHKKDPRGAFIDCSDLTAFDDISKFYNIGLGIKVKKKPTIYAKAGDSVGVVMDAIKGNLSFTLNGVNLGVAIEEIPLDNPLVPCVLLKHEGDSVELDTSEVKVDVEDSSIPVPSSIVVKSPTWDSITLTWDEVENASFYQIEVDGNKSWNMSPTNAFTKRGLLPDTEHSFRVRVVRGSSVSEWSDAVKGRTLNAPEFSECVWKECTSKPNKKRKNYRVGEKKNPKIVTRLTKFKRSPYSKIRFAIGSTPIPLGRAAVSWSVKVLRSLRGDGHNILVGVSQIDSGNSSDKKWYYCCHNSTISTELYGKTLMGVDNDKAYGPREEGRKYVRTGDSVGVVMDTVNGNLSFVLNNVNLGVAYEGIPLDKPLVPCVSLGYEGDSVELVF